MFFNVGFSVSIIYFIRLIHDLFNSFGSQVVDTDNFRYIELKYLVY